METLFKCSEKLREIDLSYNSLGVHGVGVFVRACPPGCALSKALTSLNLAGVGIREASVCASLARFVRNLTSLRVVCLAGNSMRGNEAAAVARALAECKALEECDLSSNGFGDSVACRDLARLLAPGCSIRRLNPKP